MEIAAHIVYELDGNGKQLRVVKYTDFAAEKVRSMYTSAAELRAQWSSPEEREQILTALEERGISFDQLIENTGMQDADPFDLLCYLAFNLPVRTRRERAERIRKGKVDFWDYFKPEARAILSEILDKYVEYGIAEFKLPDILRIPPIVEHGNPMEIADKFGGPEKLKSALEQMQTLLYTE